MELGATEFSDNTTYDYVIVGAGTAGCVLAARLSESPSAGMLLLEAGSSEPLDAMAVPAAWPTLRGTSADWANKTQSYDEWAVAGWGFDRVRDIGSTAVQFALGDAIALAHCAIDGAVVLAAGGWPSTTTTVVGDRPEETVGSSRHPHRGAPARSPRESA
jgi:choline dehydrogenase-like flavoprotein